MTDVDTRGGALLTRRRLVQAGGVAAAGLYLGGLSASASAATAAAVPAYLRRASYAKLTNAAFTATGASGAKVTLRLAEVSDLARARAEKSLEGSDNAFALAFSGPRATPLPGTVTELRHATLGTFAVFIAPVGRATAAEQRYEVVVDRSMTLASARSAAPG
jgi:hypothetical protein